MNMADLSIKRPIFISCLVIVMLVLGYVSMTKLGVELFPDVNPPVVSVITIYPGTGPKEIETLVTKPIEDGVSTIAGVKRITSQSIEGVSQIVAEFYMEQDIKQAEQRIKRQSQRSKSKISKRRQRTDCSSLKFFRSSGCHYRSNKRPDSSRAF